MNIYPNSAILFLLVMGETLNSYPSANISVVAKHFKQIHSFCRSVLGPCQVGNCSTCWEINSSTLYALVFSREVTQVTAITHSISGLAGTLRVASNILKYQ